MEDYTKEILTFCSECGPNVSIDEDGCCLSCGGFAFGDGVAFVEGMRGRIQSMETMLRVMKVLRSCTCCTKTNDHKYHNETCLYRKICETLGD